MSKSSKFLEAVKEYGTLGRIRNLERRLEILAADMSQIPDMYDYLSELEDKAKAKGVFYKVGSKEEDLWPASQPGPGVGAQTQLMPERKCKEGKDHIYNEKGICTKCGIKK